MLSGTFSSIELLQALLSIFLLGLVVKAMDDFLDEEWPPTRGVLRHLGRGVMPYSLVLFAMALALNFHLAWALFLACYAVGMISDASMKLPSGLASWGEILLTVGISLITVGVKLTAWSFAVILAVQLLDHLLDVDKDSHLDSSNWVNVLGTVECVLLFLLLFFLSLTLDAPLAVGVLTASLLVGEGIFKKAEREYM